MLLQQVLRTPVLAANADTLGHALSAMNVMYARGDDYTDLKVLMAVPTSAVIQALRV